MHKLHVCLAATVIFAVVPAQTEDFRPPAQNRYAQITASGTILPGGRLLRPFGTEIETGPGPFGLAISPKGTVATADIGFDRFGVTVVEPGIRKQPPQTRHIWARTPHSSVAEAADPDWKTISAGIAFDSDKSLWVSEGPSGRLRQIDLTTGDHKKIVNLNTPTSQTSFATDLVYSPVRRLMVAADWANSRIVLLDARGGRIVSSITIPGKPISVALSPDGNTAWSAIEGAVCAIDVSNMAKPALIRNIPAPSPEALLATSDRVFVSNSLDDSITVISVTDLKITGDISLRIPSLEQFKGIMPAGLALDTTQNWLLVAESGINAVGVVDLEKMEVVGHLPAGWMPTRVAISGDRVYVANAGGRGTRPNPRRVISILGEPPMVHPGSLTTFIVPDRDEVLRQTSNVFSYNGFVPYMREAPKPPAPIEHVLLIVKGSETFDEILGDIGASAGFSGLAFFGMHGRASGGKSQFSVQDAAITPNQHRIAADWAFSDNFYTNGDTAAESELYFNSKLPDLATEIPIRPGVDIHAPGGSDLSRVDRFIADITGGKPLPAFSILHLPNDRPHDPDPSKGYPYEASFYEDNDLAVGRLLDWISHSMWWKDTVVFVTEHDTEGALDHLNSRRTLLLAAGPYVKRHYASHLNSDVPGLFRTVAELLGSTPHNLTEATAASLRDIFTVEPDFSPYNAIDPDRRIFNPNP